MDVADATLVALAEELDCTSVFRTDRRLDRQRSSMDVAIRPLPGPSEPIGRISGG